MVHALKLTHSILRPEGRLVNVNDLPALHLIEVLSPGAAVKAGWLLDRDDFADERSAFHALAQVVADGYFDLEDERDFDFSVHVDDVAELQEWLAEWWQSAILPENTIRRVEELIRRAGQKAKVSVRGPARMTRLRAASPAQPAGSVWSEGPSPGKEAPG